MSKEFNLSDKECNILTNHIDLNKHIDLIIGKDIITLPQEELKFEKGFFKEDVKEFIKQRIKNIEKIQKRWIGKVCSPEVIGILQGVRHDIEENAGKDLI